jgi:hypothetical protein
VHIAVARYVALLSDGSMDSKLTMMACGRSTGISSRSVHGWAESLTSACTPTRRAEISAEGAGAEELGVHFTTVKY